MCNLRTIFPPAAHPPSPLKGLFFLLLSSSRLHHPPPFPPFPPHCKDDLCNECVRGWVSFCLPSSELLRQRQQWSPYTGVPHYASSSSSLFFSPLPPSSSPWLTLSLVLPWRVWRNTQLPKQKECTDGRRIKIPDVWRCAAHWFV